MQFLDLGDHDGNDMLGIHPRVHRLRFWNPEQLSYRTDGKITPSGEI